MWPALIVFTEHQKDIKMNAREIKIFELFEEMRDRLVSQYEVSFNKVGQHASDIVAKAFQFATTGLLSTENEFDAGDLEDIIVWKIRCLRKDAYAEYRRTHGRRSVHAICVLDKDPEYGDDHGVSLIDKASIAKYFEPVDAMQEIRYVLQVKAIFKTLVDAGVSDRDARIFCYGRFSDILGRRELAERFRTTETNVNRIVSQCNTRLKGLTDKARAIYAELLYKEECK